MQMTSHFYYWTSEFRMWPIKAVTVFSQVFISVSMRYGCLYRDAGLSINSMLICICGQVVLKGCNYLIVLPSRPIALICLLPSISLQKSCFSSGNCSALNFYKSNSLTTHSLILLFPFSFYLVFLLLSH